MHDELTAVDMQKMREELREREEVLMPKIRGCEGRPLVRRSE